MKTGLVLLAVAGSITAASAADMSPAARTAAPVYKAAPSPATNWSGFYVGAMGGYSGSGQEKQSLAGVSVTADTDLKGGFGGGTVGYNWQTGEVVLGVEADAAWSGIQYSETQSGATLADKVKAFGSVTGRIGYAAGAALIYAKGGYGWANIEMSASAAGISISDSKMLSGWTIGGGLEYMFVPNWSGKVEYMYADYGKANYLASVFDGGYGLGFTTHTFKAGVNYHFGWDSPVVARY